MDPVTASIIIGASSSLIGNFLGAKSTEDSNLQNKQLFREQMQHQSDMQDKQLDFQTQERLATQEYNSPVNQAFLYSQAGLNPLAMMSKGDSFVPSTAQTGGQGSAPAAPSMLPYHPDFSNLGSVVGQLMAARKASQEADLLSIQNQFAEQKTTLEIAEAMSRIDGLNIDNRTKDIMRDYYKSLLRVQVKSERAQITRQQAESDSAQVAYSDAQRQFEENIITRAVRVANTEMQLNLSWQQESELKSKVQLLRQQVITEHMSQKQIHQATLSIAKDIILKGQSESIRQHEVEYYKSHPNEAKNLFRLSNYLDRYVQLTQPFGFSKKF